MSNAAALPIPSEVWKANTWRKGDPRAREAGLKGAEVRRMNGRIARSLKPEASPPIRARLSQLRRTQRTLLTMATASQDPSKALEACKAARECFEIEQELLGRRPLKAGKVPRQANAEQARRALQLPDVASLPRPDSAEFAPAGYDPLAGLPPLNTGAALAHLAEAQAAPQAPQAQQRNLFSPTTVPAPPTPGPAPTR